MRIFKVKLPDQRPATSASVEVYFQGKWTPIIDSKVVAEIVEALKKQYRLEG